MPKELIIILCSILGLYIFLVVVIGIVVHSLIKDINKKHKAIVVLYAEKYDLVISLNKLMLKNDIKVPHSIKDTINVKNHEGLKVYNTMERVSIKKLLTKTVDTMLFIAEECGLKDNEDYLIIKNSIEDIDMNFRKTSASYNSQVTAYNYWIRMWIFRPISLLLKLKKKEIMY